MLSDIGFVDEVFMVMLGVCVWSVSKFIYNISLSISLSLSMILYQEMTSSVLNRYNMVQKEMFWTNGEHLYFVYYPIISYQWIKVYRDEIMDMGKISLTH